MSNKFKINNKSVKKVNQLIDPLDLDMSKLYFCDITDGTVPGTDIPFKRTNLLYKPDDTKEEYTELILSFDKLFSFGVLTNLDPKTKEPVGHSMTHCLHSREGATDRERDVVRKLLELNEKCKDYVYENRKALGKAAVITSRESEIMNQDMDKILYFKKDDNGDINPSQGPTISPRLIEFAATDKKPAQMGTVFYLADEVDDAGHPLEVDPLDYLTSKEQPKYCYSTSAMKFESIFVGKNIRLQCKLSEAMIEPMKQETERLLSVKSKRQL